MKTPENNFLDIQILIEEPITKKADREMLQKWHNFSLKCDNATMKAIEKDDAKKTANKGLRSIKLNIVENSMNKGYINLD